MVLYFFKSNSPTTFSNRLNSSKVEVNDFSLLDHQGNFQTLYRNSDAKYIVIIAHSNGCPIVQKYAATIRELKEKYLARGVAFFLINANQSDDRMSIIKEDNDYNFGAPILLDASQIISNALGFTRTSETIIISTKDWSIVYRGPIDDRLGFAVDKQTAKNNYLTNALEHLLAGQSVDFETPPAKGCSITYQQPQTISYSRDIVPLIASKCYPCHSPPVSGLLSYEFFLQLQGII